MATITGIKVGQTTITATYGGVTSTGVTFTVTSIAPTLTFTATSGTITYNNDRKAIGTVTYKGLNDEAVAGGKAYYLVKTTSGVPTASSTEGTGWVEVSNGGTVYATKSGVVTDAGTYYVFLKADAGTNYTSVDPKSGGNKTVSRATGSAGSVTNPAAQNYKDGTTTNYTFTIGISDATGTVTYPSSITVKDASNNTVSGWTISGTTITVPYAQGAGTYTVTGNITVAQSTNYEAVSATSKAWTITINKVSDASVTAALSTGTLTYAPNTARTLASVSATHGVSTYYLGYKKGSAATADSQITWGTANTSSITAVDAGNYYIYKKWTADSNHSNNGTYTQVGSTYRTIGKATGSSGSVSNPAAQNYKDGNTTNYSFTLGISGATGTVTYPSSITVKDASNNTVSGWTISGSTVTVPYSQGAGEYTVTGNITVAATDNYNAVSATSKSWTITINKVSDASLTAALSTGTLTYAPSTARTLASVSATHGVGTYYLGYKKGSAATADSQITWGTANTSSITAVDAGNYYIYKKWTADSNHSNNGTYTQVGSTYRTIGKATGSSGSVSNPAAQNYKDGNTTNYSFTLGISGATGTVTYPSSITVKDASNNTVSGWTISGSTVTVPYSQGAGEYTVTGNITVAATDNYNSVSATSKTWTITINKVADASVTVTTAANAGSYNSAATLVTAANSSSHGTSSAKIGYSLGQASSDSDITWVNVGTALSLTATANAGTYYIYKKWTADSNHSNNGTYTQVTTLTRSKITGSVGTPVNPEAQNYKDGNTTNYTFTISMSGNTGTITYPSSITVKDASNNTVSNWTISGNTITVPYTQGAGTYTVTGSVSAAASTNYNAVSATSKAWTITINKVSDASLTAALTSGTLTYNGSNKTLAEVSATHGVGTYYLGYKKGSAATADSQITWGTANASSISASSAGDYYIYYKFSPDANHSNSKTYTQVGSTYRTIGKATPTMTLAGETKAYHNTVYVKATTSVAGKVYWGTTSGTSGMTNELTVSASTATNVTSRNTLGSTTVYAYFVPTDTTNYNSLGNSSDDHTSATMEITKATDAKVTVTLNTTASTLIYNPTTPRTLATATQEGTSSYQLGYKKGSAATSDSQITWGTANINTLTASDVGTYYIYYKFSPDSNHSNSAGYTQVGTVAITKATATLPGTISGDSKEFHEVARATVSRDYVGGTLKYSTDSGSTWNNVTWNSGNLTANPSKSTLGDMSVIFKVFNTDGNYSDSAASSAVTLSVYASDDARMEVTLVSTTLTYNNTNQTIASVDTTNSTKYEGIQTYNIGYKKGAEATADSQITWNNNNSTPLQAKNAGTYYVYYKFTSDSNHSNDKTYTLVGSVTINQATANLTYSTESAISLYCTETANAYNKTDVQKTPTIATSAASSTTNGSAAITYSTSKSGWTNNGTTLTIPANTAAATYNITVSATVAASPDGNYPAKTVTNNLTVTITEVTLSTVTLNLSETTVSYGGSATVSSVIAKYSNNKTKDVKDELTPNASSGNRINAADTTIVSIS